MMQQCDQFRGCEMAVAWLACLSQGHLRKGRHVERVGVEQLASPLETLLL